MSRKWFWLAAITAATALAVPSSALALTPEREPNNSYSTANPTALYADVVSGDAREHTFSSMNDQDWIRFKATKGKTYTVKVYTSSRNSTTWVRVQPFRKVGSKLVAIDTEDYLGRDVTDTYEFRAPASAVVYVRLRPYKKTSAVAGKRYLVRVSTGFPKPTSGDAYEDADDSRFSAHPLPVNRGFNIAKYDYSDDVSTTDDTYIFDVTMNQSELHNIYNPTGTVDDDWYRIVAVNDQPHSLLLFTGFYANRTIAMELYDSAGTKVDESKFGAACYKGLIFPDLSGDTYYLRIYAKDSGGSALPYWYRLGLFAQ